MAMAATGGSIYLTAQNATKNIGPRSCLTLGDDDGDAIRER